MHQAAQNKKFGGSCGNVNVASAKAIQGNGNSGLCGVGNCGHLSSSNTRKVSQVKANQGRGPGRGTAAHHITGGGTASGVTAPSGTVQHGSRGECSLDGGRPLQDSRSGRGAQAKGAALAPRGAPGASAQGEQGRQPAARSGGAELGSHRAQAVGPAPGQRGASWASVVRGGGGRQPAARPKGGEAELGSPGVRVAGAAPTAHGASGASAPRGGDREPARAQDDGAAELRGPFSQVEGAASMLRGASRAPALEGGGRQPAVGPKGGGAELGSPSAQADGAASDQRGTSRAPARQGRERESAPGQDDGGAELRELFSQAVAPAPALRGTSEVQDTEGGRHQPAIGPSGGRAALGSHGPCEQGTQTLLVVDDDGGARGDGGVCSGCGGRQRDQEWVPVTQIGRLVKDFETESLYRLLMACQPLLLQMLEGGAWMLRLLLVSVRLLLVMMVVANSLLLRLLEQEGIDLHSLLPSAEQLRCTPLVTRPAPGPGDKSAPEAQSTVPASEPDGRATPEEPATRTAAGLPGGSPPVTRTPGRAAARSSNPAAHDVSTRTGQAAGRGGVTPGSARATTRQGENFLGKYVPGVLCRRCGLRGHDAAKCLVEWNQCPRSLKSDMVKGGMVSSHAVQYTCF